MKSSLTVPNARPGPHGLSMKSHSNSYLRGWGSSGEMVRHENLTCLLTQPPSLKDKCGKPAQILVLKVGTSTLMDPKVKGFSLSNLGKFVDTVCELKERGFHVVIISSGAVGSGCLAMRLEGKPKDLVVKQAVSAIGQCRLVRLWEDIFAIREKKVAQLLLTRRDLEDRPRFVNFRNTLLQLLAMGVIPIINENDALATEGLKFGDNDTLGAYAAISIGATWFFMLTDVDCLFTANPRQHPDAEPIAYVGKIDAIHALMDKGENDGTQWGSGGMRTKIIAAKLCCATGIHTALCHGAFPERIRDIIGFAEQGEASQSETCAASVAAAAAFPVKPITSPMISRLHHANTVKEGGESTQQSTPTAPCAPITSMVSEMANHAREESDKESSTARDPIGSPRSDVGRVGYITFPSISSMPYLGTIFAGQPCTQHLRDQRRWILSLPVRGRIFCDRKCVEAIILQRKSLFAAGIVAVEEDFYPGEAVALYSSEDMGDNFSEDNELARCIVNFSSAELDRIKGHRASEFQIILGYYCANEVASRSNIIFVNPAHAVDATISVNGNDSDADEEETALQDSSYSPVPVPQGVVHDECMPSCTASSH